MPERKASSRVSGVTLFRMRTVPLAGVGKGVDLIYDEGQVVLKKFYGSVEVAQQEGLAFGLFKGKMKSAHSGGAHGRMRDFTFEVPASFETKKLKLAGYKECSV